MSTRRTVVAGTTSDYIDLIGRRFPGRAVFLTDSRERDRAIEPDPDEASEALADLTAPDDALAALRAHLHRWDIEPGGVACFDDESMALAVSVAEAFSLPYVSAEAVAACRSKLACKQRWRQAGLPCPRAGPVRSEADGVRFLRRAGGPVVLKPLTGAGSELTFLCCDEAEAVAAFRALREGLRHPRDVRMYAATAGDQGPLDPRRVFAAEEFVRGSEHSCDFLIDGDCVEIIRIAGKVRAADQSFGTTLAYLVPGELPPSLDREPFRRQLRDAAQALGIERSVCMLDFVVRGDEAVMLELAPRPGGDCLPPLIRHSSGLDMLGLALDLAERRRIAIPPPSQWQRLVGLRLFVGCEGVVARLDASELLADPRVREVYLKRRPGHIVELPPDDYDSRLLGHVIFQPTRREGIAGECAELAAKLAREIEPAACATPMAS